MRPKNMKNATVTTQLLPALVLAAILVLVPTTLLAITDGPIVDPSWTVEPVSLEELLLAYMAPERLPTPRTTERVPLRWHG